VLDLSEAQRADVAALWALHEGWQAALHAQRAELSGLLAQVRSCVGGRGCERVGWTGRQGWRKWTKPVWEAAGGSACLLTRFVVGFQSYVVSAIPQRNRVDEFSTS
jgi:hypothetical protein